MPQNPTYDQKTDLIASAIKINGAPVPEDIQIASVSVDKRLNKISTARIELWDGDIATGEFSTIENKTYEPGKKIEISLGYHDQTDIIFKGIIVKHTIKISSSDSSRIIIECADEAIKMTGQRNFKYYPKKKDSEILNDLCSIASLTKQIDSTTKEHETVIQHNTSDWDFLVTRAQANKMVVFTDNNKVVVKKISTSSAIIELTYGESIIDMDLTIDARNQIKEIDTKAWDPGTQNVVTSSGAEDDELEKLGSLKGKKIATDLGFKKTELHSTGNMNTQELKSWADASLMISRLSKIRGTIKCQGIKIDPLQTLTLKSVGKYYEGDVVVSGVYHIMEEGNWVTELTIGLSPELFVQQKQDINLPPADGLFPGVTGLFIGKVKKLAGDPDGQHRIQVTLPMIDGTQGEGVWARVSNIMASSSFGSFFYPEIGDEVVLGALGGDMRFPIILGHLYSKKNEYDKREFTLNDDNHKKGWVTRSNMLLHFDDDKKIIRVETPGGQKFKLDDDDRSITLEDQHGNKMLMNSEGFKFSGMKDFVVDVKGKINNKAMGAVKMESMTGNFDASGMNSTLKGNVAANVEAGPSSLKATMMSAMLKGPMVMIN